MSGMSDPEAGFKGFRGVKSTMSQSGLKRNSKGEGIRRHSLYLAII